MNCTAASSLARSSCTCTESERALVGAKMANLKHGTNRHDLDSPAGLSGKPAVTQQRAAELAGTKNPGQRGAIRGRDYSRSRLRGVLAHALTNGQELTFQGPLAALRPFPTIQDEIRDASQC